MSIHNSLNKRKSKNRSVRKKWERLLKLLEDGKDLSVFEFTKEKILRIKKIKKKEDDEVEMTEEVVNE